MLIIGVDPSAKKIAIAGEETITGTLLSRSYILYEKGQTRQTIESIHRALTNMRHFAEAYESVSPLSRIAYVESPLIGRGGTSTTIKQAYVGGIIRACLAEAGFTVYDVHVSAWRRELGITAKTTKDIKAATLQSLRLRWPKMAALVESDPDLVDAASIAKFGAIQAEKASVLRAANAATGGVQGDGLDVIFRPTRMRN